MIPISDPPPRRPAPIPGPRHAWLVVAALVLAAPAQAAPVLLSEVLYDAAGSDNGEVFVELWGSPGTLLDGWVLEGINGAGGGSGPVLTLEGVVPADGFFVVADSDAGSTSVPQADLLLNFDFQNGPDSILLRDPSGAIADALGYGSFDAGEVFAGEGSPAVDPPAGQSLARLLANVDSNDNAVDFVALEIPTPGTGSVQVPEPGAPLLLGALLFTLACARRRAG